jgi:hypothetical protein
MPPTPAFALPRETAKPARISVSPNAIGLSAGDCPGGESQTAAAAPSAVIQTWSWGKARPAEAELHEGWQDSAAALLVREDPGNDRVVLKG